jgi:hypothetical protein
LLLHCIKRLAARSPLPGLEYCSTLGFACCRGARQSGALALAVRTGCLELGWNLEGASFAAALTVGVAVIQCPLLTNMIDLYLPFDI